MDFYHATSEDAIESIISNGFQMPYVYDDDGTRYKIEGCLGLGVYISRSWLTALWFNRALLRVQLVQGTRILDVSDIPDMKVINSLKREFGKDLLSRDMNFHKVIPSNKHLTCSELIELTKYHYHRTWGEGYLRKRRFHYKYHYSSLTQCLSMLRRYKYDGFGHPTSELGIMLLSPDKIEVKELVAVVREIPFDRRDREFKSIDELKKNFRKNGEKKYIELADKSFPETANAAPELKSS